MKITLEWLKNNDACVDGIEWFKAQKKSELAEVLNALMKDNKWLWANWTIVRFMTHEERVQYAVFAAEQVIGIYEKKYPEDKRPRKAIEAAKAWIDDPSEKNRAAAYAAADAAYAAAYAAARAAYAAAYAAARAAYAAYTAAYTAAYAAADAAGAASYAANAASYAADADKNKLQNKILEYGLTLLGYKK